MGKSKGRKSPKRPPVETPADEVTVDQAPVARPAEEASEQAQIAQPVRVTAVGQAIVFHPAASQPPGGSPPADPPLEQPPIEQPSSASSQKAGKPIPKALWVLLDVFLYAFWTYVLAKLFVLDVDARFVEWVSPEHVWLLDYKSVAYLLTLIFLFLALGTMRALFVLGYALVFPLVVIFWKLPKLILRQKSWVLIFAVVNTLLSFFRYLRRHIIYGSAWVVSMIVTLSATSAIFLVPSALALLAILLLVYWSAFVSVLRPSPVYQLYGRFLPQVRSTFTKDTPEKESIRNIPIVSLSDEQRKVWVQVMDPLVVYNRACLFTARKLREYQNSGVGIVSGTLRIIFILLATTLTMAAVNYALYVLHPAAFDVSVTPTRFTFFFYSVNVFVFNFIKEVTPTSSVAQGLWMLGVLFALLLGMMLISLIFTERARRHDDQMKLAIAALEDEGAAIEAFILQNYRIQSIDDAIAELERVQSSLMQIMLFFSRYL